MMSANRRIPASESDLGLVIPDTRTRRGRTKGGPLIPKSLIFFAMIHLASAKAPEAAAPEAKVWLAIRSDHQKGSGSLTDPFDAGGTEFDAVMEKIPAKTEIHIGPGIYTTRGVRLKNRWTIIGHGMDNTVVKLANDVFSRDGAAASVMCNFDFEGFHEFVRVANLTLDCNRSNQPGFVRHLNGSLNALVIAARSARIDHVRAIGTWAKPGEGFPLNVTTSGARDGSNRVEIEACENLNPVGKLTAISVFDQSGGLVSGYIRNCVVRDDPNGAGFGSGGWKNFCVGGNVTQNLGAGVVIDTHDYEDVQIVDNQFLGNRDYGILLNGTGEYRNITIARNRVETGLLANPTLMTGNASASISVRDNVFIQKSWRAPFGLIGMSTSGSLVNNIVSERMASDLSQTRALIVKGNRNSQGEKITFSASASP